MINLVLGGARSGKSRFAESLAARALKKSCSNKTDNQVVYIATATAGDQEMRDRIKHHQQSRPKSWTLVEEPFYLSNVLQEYQSPNHILLVECLTLWLSNWLCTYDEESWQKEKKAFIASLLNTPAQVILVSNEVGSGVIPMGNLSREFVDQAGWLNQSLTQLAERAHLIVAGCSIQLKPQKDIHTDDSSGGGS